MRKERSQAMKGALREYDLRRGSVRLGYVLMMVVLAVAVFVALMPILWVLLSGFKDIKELTRGIKNPETKRYVQHLLPASFSLEGYQYTWNQMRYLGDYFNSLLVVAGSVVCALLFNGLLAYGLSRLKPRGWKLIMALIMGTMMVPATTSVAPLFANLVKLGFAGSFVPLWLSAGASAFYVILFKNFYDDIPDSLLEAARLDGCNNWQMFFRIVLPLSKPISMVILIYAVNAAWSDFLLPYLLLNGVRSKWTVMVHLFTYQSAIKVTWTSRPPLSTTPVAVSTQSGAVAVEVRFDGPVSSAVVRPLALGIEPEIADGAVRFTAEAPAQLTVEVNGSVEGALHLFLNAPDEKPDPEAANVRYYAPGAHEERQIVLNSGETLYLDEGCVLYGSVFAENAENVTIAGHGVISGAIYDRFADVLVPINFENCRNVAVRGVTILDPAAWALQMYKTEGATIDDVKIVGARSNSDGITLQSCRDVKVTNCFVRSWDDSLVVKGYGGDVSEIAFEDIQIWTDLAQSCEIGYETRAEVIENVSFRNITVLHNFHKPVLSIHNSDSAAVRNVLYENITVEDARMGEGDGQPFLIDLTTTKSQWSQTKERGTIRDVTFRNVQVLSGKEPSVRIFSAKKECNIDDVTFENLVILGRKIGSLEEIKYNSSPKNGENIKIQ